MLRWLEARYIDAALAQAGGNRAKAARRDADKAHTEARRVAAERNEWRERAHAGKRRKHAPRTSAASVDTGAAEFVNSVADSGPSPSLPDAEPKP